jgi:ferredoxin
MTSGKKGGLIMEIINQVSKKIRDIIEINEELCDGCGLCLQGCAESALSLVNGKARLIKDNYCDGLGACLKECPTGALKIINRLSDDFDPQVVQSRLDDERKAKGIGSCPGSRPMELSNGKNDSGKNNTTPKVSIGLKSWPIQMELVSPGAEFLRKKALILAADCTAFACSAFHERFLDEDVPLLLGCPKLNNQELYVDKLAAILRENSSIIELRLVIMEVPCCRGLVFLTRQSLKMLGKIDINLKCNIISCDGGISKDEILLLGD